MNQTRWIIAVSSDTDQALRLFLERQGGRSEGDLSRFIEEAVRAHILELTAEQEKTGETGVSNEEMDEALQWARQQ